MTKWRQRIKTEGLEKLLEVTIRTGLKSGVLKKHQLNKVNVDTTVQPKAITYPTDAKLYYQMREKLIRQVRSEQIELRQNYRRKAKRALIMQGRYAHARPMKRARKEIKRLKTYLGRVVRDLERKIKACPEKAFGFESLLPLAHRLLTQQRQDRNKLYSIHAPEVECIAKGKVHPRYEFGCKVSVVATAKNPFVLGLRAIHGNPYDGHTLAAGLEQAERLAEFKVREAYVDRGYRRHDYAGPGIIHLVRSGLRHLNPDVHRDAAMVEAAVRH